MNQVIEPLTRASTNIATKPTKILQFGEGNFLRGFADWIIQELNNQTSFHAGIKIIQPLPNGLGNKLNSQNGLFHVLLNDYSNGNQKSKIQLIDVVSEVINPYERFDDFIKEGENPELQFIISNTTEAGIVFDSSDTLEMKPAHSFPGKLLQLLYHRYQTLPDSEPIILLPCELIDQNGQKLRMVLTEIIHHWHLGKYFENWITEKVVFCDTLVDRIVPGYPNDKVNNIWGKIGFKDVMIVKGEFFHLWAIDSPIDLSTKLPVSETHLNVVFTHDLESFRTRKVRILNGLHSAMVPIAYLLGLRTVKEAMEHELMSHFLEGMLFEEVLKTLNGNGNELLSYANQVLDRFRNPSIRHELLAISLNSFSKYRTRVLPTILELYENNPESANHLLLSLAALIRFYQGSMNGQSIPINDSPYILTKMEKLWYFKPPDYIDITHAVLADNKLWGQDLTMIKGLTDKVSHFLMEIDQKGMETVLKEFTS